jgi:hypothetical protein
VTRSQNLIKSCKRRRLLRAKAYNRHVLEKKKDRNSQDKTFIFIYYRLLF